MFLSSGPITAGGLGTAFVLKEIFHRSRPLGAIVAETSSSFPSAHAIISIAFYAFVFYLLARNAKQGFSKYLLISTLFSCPRSSGFQPAIFGRSLFKRCFGGIRHRGIFGF